MKQHIAHGLQIRVDRFDSGTRLQQFQRLSRNCKVGAEKFRQRFRHSPFSHGLFPARFSAACRVATQ